MLGRSTQTRVAKGSRRLGYDYLHAAVDDHSRVAYVEPLGDERSETCAGFLERAVVFFASCGGQDRGGDDR